jgi:chaperonin cofactor prefoldin
MPQRWDAIDTAKADSKKTDDDQASKELEKKVKGLEDEIQTLKDTIEKKDEEIAKLKDDLKAKPKE